MTKNIQKILIASIIVVVLVALFMSVSHFVFGDSAIETDDCCVEVLENGFEILEIDNPEDFFEFIARDIKDQPIFLRSSEEEWQEIRETFLNIIMQTDQDISDYIEDFDYLINHLKENHLYLPISIDLMPDLRNGIKNFFHMNDVIFEYILNYTMADINSIAKGIVGESLLFSDTSFNDSNCPSVKTITWSFITTLPNTGIHVYLVRQI
jgi:hypothetical protein